MPLINLFDVKIITSKREEAFEDGQLSAPPWSSPPGFPLPLPTFSQTGLKGITLRPYPCPSLDLRACKGNRRPVSIFEKFIGMGRLIDHLTNELGMYLAI